MSVVESFFRDPKGQFALDDFLVNVFHTVEIVLRDDKGCDPTPVAELERMVDALCVASTGDPVLSGSIAASVILEMRSFVRQVEQSAATSGLTDRVVHSEKTLSTVLAIFSRCAPLADECEELIAQLHRPGGTVHAQLHVPAYEGVAT